MVNIPAHCRKCDILFPSFITAGPNAKIRVYELDQICPRCGTPAEIISGSYEMIGGVLNLVEANAISQTTLEKIRGILENSSVLKHSPEDVVNEVKRQAPELRPIFQYLIKNKSDVYAILALLLSAMQIFLSLSPNKVEDLSSKQETIIQNAEIIVNQTIEYHNNIVIQNDKRNYRNYLYNQLRTNPSQTLKKIPLYETCPFCDSGRKFKFCCKEGIDKKYKNKGAR